jgi:drug/metabolite transporter (DMT)-like permease
VGRGVGIPGAASAAPGPLTVPHRGTGRRNDLLGVLFVLLTSIQFGSVVVLGKIATRPGGLPVPSLLAIRFGLAALLLAAALLVLRQPLAAARGEGWRLAALGMFAYGGEAGMFFASLRHGTAAALTLLFFTYPVVVAVTTFLTGRGLPGWLLGASMIAVVGGAAMVAVAGGGVDVDGAGVALALGAAFTISFYLIGAEAVLKRTNSLTGAMWVAGAASTGLGVFALVTGNAAWPRGLDQWGPVLAMAGFTAGAFVCLFAGLRRLGVVRSSILSATEPLAASTLAAIFLGESVHIGTGLGGALILAGTVAASLARGRPPSEPPIP